MSEDVILQIKNNSANIDPYLSLEYIEDGLSKSSTNWAELGSYIGANTRLQHLDVDASVNEEPWEDVKISRQFFNNIASNTSIEHLILHGIGKDEFPPSCLKQFTNLLSLKIRSSDIGGDGYIALGEMLSNPKSKLEELFMEGPWGKSMQSASPVRDGLTNNTTLKKLKLVFFTNRLSYAWACRNSSIEELTILDASMDDTMLIEMAPVLKKNTTLKTLKLGPTSGYQVAYNITTTGWDALSNSLRTNTSLTELDLSYNSINDESITTLMTILAGNTTLTTLRLEYLGQVTRDGWRSIATVYLRSPTCALENLYLGGNTLDGGTFRELGSACYPNRTLKKLCLKLPSNRSLNTPRVGWNPWTNSLMRIVYNKESIMQTYNSNHVLETICYPHEEARFVSAMASSPLMGKDLPSALQMNRDEPNKSVLARRKILESHYYNQDTIRENREYRGYKTVVDTIVDMTDNMESTEQLPNIMSWIGRDNDGLTLMFELIQSTPTLCERVAALVPAKRKRSE